jgi:streptogramin lyase
MDEGTRLLRREAERPTPPAHPLPGIMERLARRQRRRRLGSAGVALVVATAGLLVAYSAFRSPDPLSVQAEGVARVTAAIDVEGQPGGIAAGYGRIWVVGRQMTWPDGTTWPDDAASQEDEVVEVEGDPVEDALLQAIDPASNQVVLRVSLREQLGRGVSPGMLVVGAGAVWVSDGHGGWIHKVDPATGDVVGSFEALDRPISVLRVAAGHLWYVAEGDPRVDRDPRWEALLVKVDPDTLETVATSPIGRCCAADLVEAGGALWLGHQVITDSRFHLEVLRIDPLTGETLEVISLDSGHWTPGDSLLGYMAASPRSVWVPRPSTRYVDRIDTTTGDVTARIPTGSFLLPDGAAWQGDFLWLGSLAGDRLARIDPGTNAVLVDRLDLPPIAHARAAADGALWVGESEEGRILRIELVHGPLPGPSPS